jgi:transposase InsO family protein
MTDARSAFAEHDTDVHGSMRFSDGSTVGIEGRETVLFRCKTGEHQKLIGVYFIPRLIANIISLGQLEKEKFKIVMADGALKVWDPRGRLVAAVRRGARRLYILNADVDKPVRLAAHAEETTWRWHTQYGHLGFQGMQMLERGEMVCRLPRIEHVDQVCDGCLVGKQRRLPFPAASKYRAARQLELVHADLCGPITPPTAGGKKMFLLVVDDMSRYMWLVLLDRKDEAAAVITRLQARTEAEVGHKLGTLRTDRGGELTAQAFMEYCAGKGVQRHLTALYTPQHNGVMERRNQTVLGMARCMLKSMGIPGRFWGEAVTTTVFVLNRAPTRALEDKTPYEAWYAHKPAVHFLHTFGCVAHVKVAGGHLRKLDDRSTPMVLIGYEPGTKAYRLYNPVTDRVHVARDVVFEEGRAWNLGESGTGSSGDSDDDPFVVEYEYVYTRGAASTTPEREAAPRATSRTSTTTSSGPGTAQNMTASVPVTSGASSGARSSVGQELGGTPAPVTPAGVEFVSPPSHGVYEDNDNDSDVSLRFRRLDDVFDIYDELQEQGLMVAVGEGEPTTFDEARHEQSWIKAR